MDQFPKIGQILIKISLQKCQNYCKQAENGLQSRSSENGSVALWIEIEVILDWRFGMVWYGLVGIVCMGGG